MSDTLSDTPMVSVIVPNYNYARFLHQRLGSIVNQTYKNFELIILDDCSSDNSRDIIEMFRDNPFVSCIEYNLSNSGSPFIQWKKGIDMASGDLIWIAEADDYSDVSFLEKSVSKFTQYENVSMVYCGNNYVNDKDDFLNIPHNEIVDGFYQGHSYIQDYLYAGTSILNISSVLFSARYAKKISSDYVNFRAAGDHLFAILMAQLGNVVSISEKLNFLRIHEDSVTPRLLMSGVSLNEEFKIHQFLVRNNLISNRRNLESIIYYMNYILSVGDGERDDTRKRCLRNWNPLPFLPPRLSLSILRRVNRVLTIFNR